MDQVSGSNYKKGLWFFLGFFVIFLILNVLVGKYLYNLALYHEILDIAIPILIYLKVTKQPIRATLKLDKKISKNSVLIIFQLFLISFLLKMGINYLVLLTGSVDPTDVTSRVIDMVPNLFLFFIAVAVLPVFLEEIIIRGVILNYFKNISLWKASVITGLLFGFMHVDLGQLGYTSALGIIMAAIVISTGSLWGSILFHFLNNFLTFAVIAIYQIIEKFIPKEYLEIFTQNDSSVTIVQNSLIEKIYGITFALVCLGLGIFLTIHYVKKLQRVNLEEVMKKRDLEDIPVQELDNEAVDKTGEVIKVTWKNLFINVPFLLIVALYIGINLLLLV